ncbi:MAG: alpha/beta hydrolase-fold protein [Candidatus Nanopelagicales bacterium]
MRTLTDAGRLDELVISSDALRDNPLGDPHERAVWVYVPPGYDDQPAVRYPSIYVIQGFTGQLEMWANRTPFGTPYPQAADAVFAAGAPPCIVVYVDAWTRYGGSQFVDSPGTGRYHCYLCDDLVAFVDERYRTIDAPASRAITGKSSGGFGAMITPMLRPDLFGALATHAGDALHELCYIPEFGPVVRALRRFDGDPHRWWADFQSRAATGPTTPADQLILGIYGVAACFSADPDGTPVLPFDPVTGVLRDEVWAHWLAVDPVRMAPEHAAALCDLRAVWIDAGTADDFHLDIGAQAFRAALATAGVPDERIHFELFEGTHAGITHRYPLALAWLAERLAR